jgi:hypothetical protein
MVKHPSQFFYDEGRGAKDFLKDAASIRKKMDGAFAAGIEWRLTQFDASAGRVQDERFRDKGGHDDASRTPASSNVQSSSVCERK